VWGLGVDFRWKMTDCFGLTLAPLHDYMFEDLSLTAGNDFTEELVVSPVEKHNNLHNHKTINATGKQIMKKALTPIVLLLILGSSVRAEDKVIWKKMS
jgi:hypothetical protein